MTGSEALDLQLADLGYTGDAAAHFRAGARVEVARLRAVEKAARAVVEVDYDDGPNEAAWAVAAADLSAALEAKP